MTGRELLAVAYDQVIGTVTQASRTAAVAFTYDTAYVGGLPRSTFMPPSEAPYSGQVVEVFTEGLLPKDPGSRVRWGRELGVAADDSLALLAQMGWDAPGAVQFCARRP